HVIAEQSGGVAGTERYTPAHRGEVHHSVGRDSAEEALARAGIAEITVGSRAEDEFAVATVRRDQPHREAENTRTTGDQGTAVHGLERSFELDDLGRFRRRRGPPALATHQLVGRGRNPLRVRVEEVL